MSVLCAIVEIVFRLIVPDVVQAMNMNAISEGQWSPGALFGLIGVFVFLSAGGLGWIALNVLRVLGYGA